MTVETAAIQSVSFPYILTEKSAVLAKLTSKNQLTLPKAVLSTCQGTEYFDVTEDNGRIVLTPVRLHRADAVRAKLADLGITERDVAEAVRSVRKPTGRTPRPSG
ncbi:MAG: hypothetical protein RLZZ440_705 [Planctomycetota bacterium]